MWAEFFTYYCEKTSDQKGFNGQPIMPTLICHRILMAMFSTENWYSGMPEELRTSTLRTSVKSRCDGNSDLKIFLSNHRTALHSNKRVPGLNFKRGLLNSCGWFKHGNRWITFYKTITNWLWNLPIYRV